MTNNKMLKIAVVLLLFAVAIAFPATNETVKNEPSGRVVGGNNAVNGQFPFVASIRNANNVHTHQGALISNRWVVSVAWIMQGRTAFNTRVAFGSVVRNQGFMFFLRRLIVHPEFNSTTGANDISLLQTIIPVFHGSLVFPASLTNFRLSGGERVTTLGWGNTMLGENTPQANSLQWISLQVTNDQTCRNFFANDPNFPLANGLCGISDANMRGMCAGDEGGPMVIGNTVHGLMRISPWCGQGTNPDIFVPLFDFKDWIASVRGF
ncbi:CLUMA_CG009265, isoform A [Clunio marinus]|uniref:CLUMA_CG009265, isoform A n=1 Tax=Clunio marinus TaxID=568069 RepID=A0A1J1I685_9DIPT|nr:CLUMA_CG009265, isoform A [Clunio marinus]